MQHLNADLVPTVMEERLKEARAQQRADILLRARRQARRAEAKSRPSRLRLARATFRATGLG